MFISKHYREKLWTNHERKSAQSRAFQESQEYVLPARFDDTEIPGLANTVGYISLEKRTPEEFAALVEEKLLAHGFLDDVPLSVVNNASFAEILRQSLKATKAFPVDVIGVSAEMIHSTRISDHYKQHCRRLYGHMQILAMAKPVELQHIYTEVRLADQIQHTQSKAENEITRNFLRGKRGIETRTLSASEVATSVSKLVLLGRPGCGKSTFLRSFLLEQLAKDGNAGKIPILLPLNQIQEDQSILESIAVVLSQSGIEASVSLIYSLLGDGRLRLLIDGLDEVRQSYRSGIVGQLDSLMKRFQNCDFIITCRSAAYEFWFSGCHHYEIQPFSEQAIVSFVSKWFGDEPSKAEELCRQVTSNARLRDLCSNPLMLTIVGIGFGAGVNVSNNRAEIYKDAIDALLKRWDSSRSVYRDNLYRSLTPKRREDLLAELAARTFVDDQVVFSNTRANEIVSGFISAMPESNETEIIDDAEGVLNAIEVQHGLIEKRSLSFWAFAHLTFQEFFLAQYLSSRDPELRARVVREFIDRPDWREVIVLTATLVPVADEFVIQILESMTKIGYGTFFFRQLRNELTEARKSAANREDSLGQVLDKRNDRIKKRADSMGLRVVDGGPRLNVSDLRLALDQFRQNTGAQIHQSLFRNLWIDEDLQIYRTRFGSFGRTRKQSLYGRAVDRVVSELTTEAIGAADGTSLFPKLSKRKKTKIYRQAEKLGDWLRQASDVLAIHNPEVPARLDAVISSSNIFERTNRKHIYLLPETVDDLIGSLFDVVGSIEYGDFRAELLELSNESRLDINWSPDTLIASLENVLKIEVEADVRGAAAFNARDLTKLRAFIAGEILADILLSQAYLSPRVREIAARTLNNLVTPPTPPEGTPPRSGSISARA